MISSSDIKYNQMEPIVGGEFVFLFLEVKLAE